MKSANCRLQIEGGGRLDCDGGEFHAEARRGAIGELYHPFIAFCHFARNKVFAEVATGIGIHHLGADRFANITEIGRSALWNDEIQDCVHQNHIIRVRFLGGLPS